MSAPGPAAARSVALSLIALRGLAGWDDVEALSERAVEALGGGEGLSRADVDRLRRWPSRWSSVRSEIRWFYRAALDSGPTGHDRVAVSLGLLAILDARPPEGWVVGTLRRLHLELLAEESGVDLCPTRIGPRPHRVEEPGSDPDGR